MLRVATSANEALLLDYARLMTASQLEQTCRKYALVLRHGQDPHPLGDLQRRYVRRRDTEDGMVKIEAVLHPEEAELVWTMLSHSAGQMVRSTGSSTPEAEPSSKHVSAETELACASRSGADEAEALGAGEAAPEDNAQSAGTGSRTLRPPSELHRRADAVQRAFSRADALVSLAQGYLSSASHSSLARLRGD
jgi:hypothetical protein